MSPSSPRSRTFLPHIRRFNSAFAFASCGGANPGDPLRFRNLTAHGPYTFVLQGQLHHYFGSIGPQTPTTNPRYSQIYFYSGEDEQLGHRLNNFPELQDAPLRDIARLLQSCLQRVNPYTNMYRPAGDRQQDTTAVPGRIFLRAQGTPDPRRYNATAAPREVAAIIPGTDERQDFARDIIVQDIGGHLRRICENHDSLDALTYPILNPTGESGYHLNIPLHLSDSRRRQTNTHDATSSDPNDQPSRRTRTTVSKREYTAYRLTYRTRQQPAQLGDPPLPLSAILHRGGRLLQQWAVDYACQIEFARLQFQRLNQATLRQHELSGLSDAIHRGLNPANIGRTATVLSSSFTGGPRYMTQRYLDAMAIVRHFGKPDLFVTFTCNPSKFDCSRSHNFVLTPVATNSAFPSTPLSVLTVSSDNPFAPSSSNLSCSLLHLLPPLPLHRLAGNTRGLARWSATQRSTRCCLPRVSTQA